MEDRMRHVEIELAKQEERVGHITESIADLSHTIKGMAKTLTDIQVRFAVIVGGILVLEKLVPVIMTNWRS